MAYETKKSRRIRSVSEPGLRLRCSDVFRERKRDSEVGYETGKDRAAFCLSRLSSDEVCVVLYYLLSRCNVTLLTTLQTTLESLPHRDLQLSAVGVASGKELRPVSTPLSRAVRVRLRKSRRPQNKRLHRAQSVDIHEQFPIQCLSPTPITPHSRETPLLPGLTPSLTPFLSSPPPPPPPPPPRPSTTPAAYTNRLLSATPRRHLLATPTSCDLLTSNHHQTVSSEVTHFLTWFSNLSSGWQQKEVLQMIVRILEVDQKYYLSSLLMTRNYRDPVTCLPLPLALHLLSFIPVKHLLRNCSTVCSVWNERCTNEDLWQGLCTTSRLGLPGVRRGVLWREMFLESLRMKFNWWRRRCTSTSLSGHSGRVLCVRVRGDMVATGSTDATIRIWSVETGQCIQVLTGHSRGVWCLTFFGKRLLISGSIDQSIKVWNITTGVCEKTARDVHSGSIWCLQVKREVLITGSQDKTVSQ